MRATCTRLQAIKLMEYCEKESIPYHVMNWDNYMLNRMFLSYQTVSNKNNLHVVINCSGVASQKDIEYYNKLSFRKFKSMIIKGL